MAVLGCASKFRHSRNKILHLLVLCYRQATDVKEMLWYFRAGLKVASYLGTSPYTWSDKENKLEFLGFSSNGFLLFLAHVSLYLTYLLFVLFRSISTVLLDPNSTAREMCQPIFIIATCSIPATCHLCSLWNVNQLHHFINRLTSYAYQDVAKGMLVIHNLFIRVSEGSSKFTALEMNGRYAGMGQRKNEEMRAVARASNSRGIRSDWNKYWICIPASIGPGFSHFAHTWSGKYGQVETSPVRNPSWLHMEYSVGNSLLLLHRLYGPPFYLAESLKVP